MLIHIFDHLIKYEIFKKEYEKTLHLFIMDQQQVFTQNKNKFDKLRKLIIIKELEKENKLDKYALDIDNEDQELTD